MQSFDMNTLMDIYGTIIPIFVLRIEYDEDREFLSTIYLEHRALMYKVASKFHHGKHAEIDDIVGISLEKLCKNCETLKGLDCYKLRAYIVATCRNACISRYRELLRQSEKVCFMDTEMLNAIPSNDEMHQALFVDLTGAEVLAAFPELSDKERGLILMRHVEQLDYSEIAIQLGVKESSARIAVSRAKSKLIKLAKEEKWDGVNE